MIKGYSFVKKILSRIRENYLKIVLFFSFILSLVTLSILLLLISNLKLNILELFKSNEENKISSEINNILPSNSFDNKKEIKDLENKVMLLLESNNKIINSAESCKLFAYNYFLFFEKANELFANGTSGCAKRYIESGNANKFPSGCFRIDAGKGTNEYRQRNWYQNPDQKYYDSLSYYYYQYLKYQNDCIKKLEKIEVSKENIEIQNKRD